MSEQEKIPEQEKFIEEWVKSLPQGEHIKLDDALHWYDSVLLNDPDRFEWHFNRLKGVGGSDVGEIVASYLNFSNNFKTPYSLFKDKLMQNPIFSQTPHMRRGSYLEPVIAKIFYEDFGCEAKPELMDQISKVHDKNYPWLAGNVDDVVSLSNQLYIVDYKSSTYAPNETNIQYAAQVHQYDYLLAVSQGKDIDLQNGPHATDGYLIVYFDYINGGTVRPIEVPYRPEITEAILEGSKQFWECVINGVPPEIKIQEKPNLELSNEEKEKARELEQEVVQYNLIAQTADMLKKDKQTELTELMYQNKEGVSLKEYDLPIETCTPKITESIDKEKLQYIIQANNLDNEELMSEKNKLDEKKVKEFIKSHKMKIKDFKKQDYDPKKIREFCRNNNIEVPISESVSFSLQADSKGIKLDKETLQKARAHTKEFIEQHKDEVGIFKQGDSMSFGIRN